MGDFPSTEGITSTAPLRLAGPLQKLGDDRRPRCSDARSRTEVSRESACREASTYPPSARGCTLLNSIAEEGLVVVQDDLGGNHLFYLLNA